jgi:hypothetical protein
MSQKTDSQQIKLPEGKMISLCQAVTAFAVGKASDSFDYDLFGEAETEEERAKIKNLIQQLHSAAYAGRIRFRALRNGDSPADGHKDIDPLYFSERRGLRWDCDEIWVSGLSPRRPTFESQGRFTMDWHDVHLDREDFEALLQAMDVSVVQSLDADAPGKRKTLTTGMPGRPTSRHLILEIARRRLDAGNYPPTLAAFSRELADALAKEEPGAARMTPKTVSNAVRPLWRAHQKKPPKPASSS